MDDKADGGRVTRLAEKIKLEYQALTTEDIDIFVDRTHLSWGQQWRNAINGSLQSTTFYIPIITPNFIESAECRREFLTFVNTARSLGVEEYILAIRYIPVTGLGEDSADEIKALVAGTQFEDWEELRFEDEDGPLYRRAVNKLARRLKELSEIVESRPSKDPAVDLGTSADVAEAEQDDDDAPGLIDLMGDFEPASQEWLATINKFAPLINEFSSVLKSATPLLQEANGKSFAHKIAVLRDTAKELEPSTKGIEEAGQEYVNKLLAIDPSMRAMIEMAKAAEPGTEDESAAQVQFASIKKMALASKGAADSVSNAGALARQYSKYSRDLRPAFKRYEAGAKAIVDGQSVIDEWERLVDETGFVYDADEDAA